jgi:multidrug efflux pump subunit AcrA (membrane-fusion protein)
VEIAKAREGTARAVRDTAKANEEVARLTKESLQTQYNLEKTKTSVLDARANVQKLQIAADVAKTAQQRVELDLAKQQQRAANAELQLAEIRKRQEPRRITLNQRQELQKYLSDKPKGRFEILFRAGDLEAYNFAFNLWVALRDSGWESESADPKPTQDVLLEFTVRTPDFTDARYRAVVEGLAFVGLGHSGGGLDSSLPLGTVRFIVGSITRKPFPEQPQEEK